MEQTKVRFVFVVDAKGRPLAPTKLTRAISLVKAGKAVVLWRCPIVIRLNKVVPNPRKVVRPYHVFGADFVKTALVKVDTKQIVHTAYVELPTKDIRKRLVKRKERRRYRRRWRHRRGLRKPRQKSRFEKFEGSILNTLTRILVDWYNGWLHFWNRRVAMLPPVVSFRYRPKLKIDRDYLRRLIRTRDGGCVLCRRTDNLHVHHIVPRSRGGKDAPDNLVTLCQDCHEKVHERKLSPSHVELFKRWVREHPVNDFSAWATVYTPDELMLGLLKVGRYVRLFKDLEKLLERWFELRPPTRYLRNTRHRRQFTYYVRPDRVYKDVRTGRVVAWNRRRRWGQKVDRPSVADLVKAHGPKITSYLVIHQRPRVAYLRQRDYRSSIRRLDVIYSYGKVGVVQRCTSGDRCCTFKDSSAVTKNAVELVCRKMFVQP